MRDLSDVSLKPSDFAALAALCRNDRDFPTDVAEWERLIVTASKDAHARQRYVEPLLLDVVSFGAWCERVSIVPCIDALRAYVIIKRGEVS